MKTTNLKLEIHRGLPGLEQIEQQWNELFSNLRNPTYTQSAIWHKAYLRHLCSETEKCYYFCVLRNDKLIAVFPFEQRYHRFYFIKLNTLKFSDHSHFGLNSVVIDEAENAQRNKAELLKLWQSLMSDHSKTT